MSERKGIEHTDLATLRRIRNRIGLSGPQGRRLTEEENQMLDLLDRLIREARSDQPLPTQVPLLYRDGGDEQVVYAQEGTDCLTLTKNGVGDSFLTAARVRDRLTPLIPPGAVVVQRPETLHPSVWNRDSLIQMARTLMFGGRTPVQTIARSAAVVRAVAEAMPREEES